MYRAWYSCCSRNSRSCSSAGTSPSVTIAAGCCAELDRLGVEHSGPCWLEMGPDLPMIDGLNAVFFRDPDGTMLELIETPRFREA